MIILDKPYLSNFLHNYLKSCSIPVLKNEYVIQNQLDKELRTLSTEEAIQKPPQTLLTISENSLDWLYTHLPNTEFSKNAQLFKNKALLRERLQPMYPDLFFKRLSLAQIQTQKPEHLPETPFVIKPNIGFFSLGVRSVQNQSDWPKIQQQILSEASNTQSQFPKGVIDHDSFILEAYISGEEYAIDAFADANGNVHILGILKHDFSSTKDVSDRVYFTSKEIILQHSTTFQSILTKICKSLDIRNFPFHAEFRMDKQGHTTPIEINPLRFAGWCTSADLTYYAYGVNPYECVFSTKPPNWQDTLKTQDNHLYSIIVLNNSTGVEPNRIKAFDYDKLLSTLSNPLDLRKTDYKTYPVFGFVFAKTDPRNKAELERLLKSDLREFIETD